MSGSIELLKALVGWTVIEVDVTEYFVDVPSIDCVTLTIERGGETRVVHLNTNLEVGMPFLDPDEQLRPGQQSIVELGAPR